MRIRLLRSRALSYVVVTGVALVAAGSAVYFLGVEDREYSSSATLAVSPVGGTGDPDRVVATQVAVLESRSMHDAVAAALGPSVEFSLTASQVRLSNVVVLEAISSQPQGAADAAAAATSAFLDRQQSPRLADLAVIDTASAATASGSPLRNALLAGVAAAVLASAALLALVTARPRVRRAYTEPPENALLIELPEPSGTEADAAASAALARLSEHLAPQASAVFSVSALPGVGEGATQWVANALREQAGRTHRLHDVARADGASTVPDTTDPGAELAIVVARAWVDEERELRRLIAARRAFADVLVVVLGARQPALVPPRSPSPTESLFRAEDIGRRRSRRDGGAA